jgi:uncharacterized protein YndB with AHSA1/START domain
MKITMQSEHPVTDDACQAATGKTMKEWYAGLDAHDGIKIGRRNSISAIYEAMKGHVWWTTTVAVEYEREKGLVKKDGLFEGYGICSTKTVNAPVDATYSAFSTPTALNEWFGEGLSGGAAEGDEFSSADGKGKWLRLRPGKDVRFTWRPTGAESDWLIDAMLADKAGKTAITVNSTRIQNRAEADGCRTAWGEALNRLKAKFD